jgi:spore maturation protein CgeB
MADDWDRRIRHDYRYWMSDGVATDAEMWATGERDMELLLRNWTPDKIVGTALEIGCGVGRLVRAFSFKFTKVIGVDVSPAGIEQAAALLKGLDNISLHVSDGLGLRMIESATVDFVYSFAALQSMPLEAFVGYLLETQRVLKLGGVASLQVYLGSQATSPTQDTLSIRSYGEQEFRSTVERLGFAWKESREITDLPFDPSDRHLNHLAKIVRLEKIANVISSEREIVELLGVRDAASPSAAWLGSETEYLMALARAKQHLEGSRLAAAKEALEFAVRCYGSVDTDVKELLAKIRSDLGETKNSEKPATATTRGDVLDSNRRAIETYHPHLMADLGKIKADGVEIRVSGNGESVVIYRGNPLGNVEKPKRAGEIWAQQVANSFETKSAEELYAFGLGSAYQLEQLIEIAGKPIHLVEPNREVFDLVIRTRDISSLLSRLQSISFDTQDAVSKLRSSSKRAALVEYVPTKMINSEKFSELQRVIRSKTAFAELNPRVAVVGPIYGGSLPIAQYALRALGALGVRSMGYSFRSFHQPFKDITSHLKEQGRKDKLETQFVEMLSSSLLEGINERPVDILICLAQAPVSPTVLTELRSRGVITVMWFVEDCNRFQSWRHLAPYFDFFFIIQKEKHIKNLLNAGAGSVNYLPVGCDPGIHAKVELSTEERERFGSELSFVGAGYNNRQHVFARLASRDFKIWGTEWPGCLPFTKLLQSNGSRIEPEDYVKIFNSSTINLNLHSSSERDGVEPYGDFVNPRTFELASSQAFQLVDNRELMPEMFEIGTEMATFSDEGEMEDRIDYYLRHPGERAQLVERSYKRVISEHTYAHRMRSMLEIIYADRYDQLKAREVQSPWTATLRAAEEFPELFEKLSELRTSGEDPKLDGLIDVILKKKGELSESDRKLLFLHHIRKQIATVEGMRGGKAE